jgi:hypothetical protein
VAAVAAVDEGRQPQVSPVLAVKLLHQGKPRLEVLREEAVVARLLKAPLNNANTQ